MNESKSAEQLPRVFSNIPIPEFRSARTIESKDLYPYYILSVLPATSENYSLEKVVDHSKIIKSNIKRLTPKTIHDITGNEALKK